MPPEVEEQGLNLSVITPCLTNQTLRVPSLTAQWGLESLREHLLRAQKVAGWIRTLPFSLCSYCGETLRSQTSQGKQPAHISHEEM